MTILGKLLRLERQKQGLNSRRNERVRLEGGLSQTGRPAELVRFKNGQSISLRTGAVVQPEFGGPDSRLKRSVSVESDDDTMRSMARRRKSAQNAVKDVQRCSDCDKVFKRPCDLTYVTFLRPYSIYSNKDL